MKGEVMSKSVVLIEGDGIGPEVAKATQRVLDAGCHVARFGDHHDL